VNKFKMILLLIVLVVLADFAWESKALQPQELKLFTFNLGKIPPFLLAYLSLALGLIVGWLGHALRIRKKKKQVAAAALSQEKQAQAQQNQEASQ
jgi:heptaprenylglyceryl phosphate synthase